MNIKDEWGGIDKKIEPLVVGLNKLNIPTIGSCEGHIDHGYPSPWVSIGDKKTKARMASLLDKFYSDRSAAPDIKIQILDGLDSIWIHSMDGHFIQWRVIVNKHAEDKLTGKDTQNLVMSDDEKIKRIEILPKLQSEFIAFADFIEK
jgi:hypothetical protein